MSVFKINTIGTFSIKEKSREFYKMLIGGVIFYLALLLAVYYTVNQTVFLILFLSILYVGLFIYIPITLKYRINKVVRQIQFFDNQIIIHTHLVINLDFREIEIKEVKNMFSGFSIRDKSGILLRDKRNKEYWLIEEFFNDYQIIKEKLFQF